MKNCTHLSAGVPAEPDAVPTRPGKLSKLIKTWVALLAIIAILPMVANAQIVSGTTNPSTCGGTDGKITISGLLLNQPYIVYYVKNGTGLPGAYIATANGAGVLEIVTWGSFNVGAGTYSDIQVSDGVTTSFFAGPYVLTNPLVTANAVSHQTLCAGNPTTAVNFTGTAITYDWTNDNTSIGLAASGTGNISSFVATNSTAAPITANIIVVPSNNGICTGTPVSFSITVNPTPTVNTVSNQMACNGLATTAVNFSSTTSGTTYSWTNNQTSIGLGASGNTGIASFTATNTGNTPVVATVTVTPSANGCPGSNGIFTITVPPTPTVNAISNQTLCNGASTTAVNFNGALAGTTYNWVNNTISVGLGASGNTNIGTFTAVNTGIAPVTATVTVTPAKDGCNGTPGNFTITVNPTPTVNAISNQTLCNAGMTNAINFSGAIAGTTYNWTNNTPSIGLAASGNGNIGAFAAINTGTIPVTATITVTPTKDGCPGTPVNFNVTVNPTPTVNTVSDQILCNNAMTTAVNFNGAVAGATYNWTNTTPSIGLAANGNTNIASFAAVNTGITSVSGLITVTPTKDGCPGTAKNFVITVNPTPVVNGIFNQAVCNGAMTNAVNFSGAIAGTTYNWVNNTPSIGLAASGNTNIASFAAVNTGTTPVVATITVTPTKDGCAGAPAGFIITVNPTPTVNPISNQALCNGAASNLVSFGGALTGTTYSWTNNNTSIGLAASGNTDIATFTAVNTGTTPVSATITVTPSKAGCTGTTGNFIITVNPTPTVNTIANQTLCNGAPTVAVAFGGAVAGSTYSWTNNTTSIGLAAGGNANINAFTAVNTTSAPVVATITVTPLANGCTGASKNFTITVNPTPVVNPIASQTLCNASSTLAANFSGAITGTSYSWVNTNIAIGLAASGTGNIPSFTATNTGNTTISGTVTVTPSANGCAGSTKNFTFTVYPTPVVNTVANQTNCNGTLTNAVTLAGSVAGATYSWTNNTTSIGLSASGTAAIPAFTAVNASAAPIVATVTVTPAANGCIGANKTFTYTVNPTPTVNTVANQTLCNGSLTAAIAFGSPVAGATYSWTNSNTTIGLVASGTGNIASFMGTNTTTAPEVATITVTPTANACVGTIRMFTITVNPTPVLTSTLTPPAICDNGTFNYLPQSATAGTAFGWNRAAVSGISNPPATGTNNPVEILHNTTAAPVTVTYVYTLTANGCVNTQNVSVVVNPTPVLTHIATDSICSGLTYQYTPASTTVGTSFAWERPVVLGIEPPSTGYGINAISEVLVNHTQTPLVVSYIYTLTANGCANTQTITVKVNPRPVKPAITTKAEEEVCSQTMYQNFGANQPAPSGYSYAWTGVNADIWAGATNQFCLVNFPQTGSASVVLTTTNNTTGCDIVTRYAMYVEQSVAPQPKVTYYNGRFVCLLNGVEYIWGYDDKNTFDSTVVLNETSQDYQLANPDFANRYYWVMVKDGTCQNKSYYNQVTSIAPVAATLDMNIYPNPAHDRITIAYNEPLGKQTTVTITDISGRVMKQQLLYSQSTVVDVSSLTPGMYMVNCYSKDAKVASARFVKID